MGQGTVQLDKPRCANRGATTGSPRSRERSLGRCVCEPRGHDWFPTVPGEEPGEMRVRVPRPARLHRRLLGGRGAAGSSDPQTGPAQPLVAWEERSSPPPEPTSRVTWHALYVCAKGW